MPDNEQTRPKRQKRWSPDTLPSIDWKIEDEQGPLRFPRPDTVKVGLIQFPPIDDIQANIQRALQLAWQAAEEGADIVFFPEMFMLPWVFADDTPRHEHLAQTPDDPIWQPLRALAAERNIVLICSFFERGMEGRFYNSVLVIDTDGTTAGRYRKHHLPPDNERVHYVPDKGPYSAFSTRKGRLGVYICWDNFFPVGAQALAIDAADLVFAPSAATEWNALYKWKTAIQYNAMITGLPWIRLNRCEPPFYSHLFAVNAEGQAIHDTSDPDQSITLITIDYRETQRVRQVWPFLED